ncbi:hypothetical protein ASC61_01220 [Aeromicrobium sp. Root344]|uniref:hypothetical protein n=1 Tax=Aeromicrobium sp. Root344 TaxID=1736521 RepID=UPI0006F414E0|nr:hypothetical protein [Aeromicrobium sp. Root344]KQV73742.1 hypothetical protein ASC61_01220 [Aeromicrobium sp. Root344]
MNPTTQSDLTRIGDDLEQAVTAQIAGSIVVRRRRKQRSRTTIAAFATAGVIVVGAGAAAAVTLLSPDTVERGMPGSSVIFIDTDPTCTKTSDVEFDCTLAKAPSKEILPDYKGAKETFNDADDNIAGGCIGQDSAGLHWTCYAGEKAVEMDIIGPDLLGEHTNGPAAG